MKPFKVHLRRKPMKDNQESLYLDFSRPVRHEQKDKMTRRHFLGLYIHTKPRDKNERDHNRFTLEKAELERGEVYRQITNGTYGKDNSNDAELKRLETDFLEFYRSRMNVRKGRTKRVWNTALTYLKNFTNEKCKVRDISKNFLLDFKDYLDTETELGQNTKALYFTKLKTAVKEAADKELLIKNFAAEVENFKTVDAQRPFLVESEIQLLRNTPFPDSPLLWRMGIFSILTSLRWSDIRSIRHEYFSYDEKLGWLVDFRIIKTDCPDILYLTPEAFDLCEHSPEKTGEVFPCVYSLKEKLTDWFKLAGVKKREGIDFHIFRHTFAMRAINRGERIEDISAMMGHKNIETTRRYARLLNEGKKAAAHRVRLD